MSLCIASATVLLCCSTLLPEERRTKIDPVRNSKLYYKTLYDLSESTQVAPAGKRIGF